MPRSGPPTYLYSLPPVYLAVPGTVITASQHNEPFEDIASTFNSIQPVVWGGTGSGNAAGARANLGAAGLDSGNTFTGNQTIRLADDTAAAGPLLTLDRNSASPAASDLLGEVVFSGRDSGAGTQTYALLGAEIVDPLAATEDGRFLLQTVIAGVLATRFYVGAGLYGATVTGGDKGVGSVNAAAFYFNGVSPTPGYLYGLTLANNVADAANDIDFAAGQAVDDTGVSMAAIAAMTKRLDANWAPGTNQGMRYSGAAITNTTYHCYAVWKVAGADPDFYADPSPVSATALAHLQAETGGSAYAFVRRVGPIVRLAGSITPFVQFGDTFLWGTMVNEFNTSISTSTATMTLTVPTGIVVKAILSVAGYDTSPSDEFQCFLFTALSQADSVPSATNFSVGSYFWGALARWGLSGSAEVYTNTSAQVRRRFQGSTLNNATINTIGFVDTRGRFP